MGHISAQDRDRDLRIDLSPANVQREDHLLIDDLREHGELPGNHYWSVVLAYRENDLRRTGNDDRFDRDHPWVGKVLDRYEAEQRLLHITTPPVAHLIGPVDVTSNLPTGTPKPPAKPAAVGVPEPSGMILFGIALFLSWLALSRRGWPRRGCRFVHQTHALTIGIAPRRPDPLP